MTSSTKKFLCCAFACKHVFVIFFSPKNDQVPVVVCIMCTAEDSWVVVVVVVVVVIVVVIVVVVCVCVCEVSCRRQQIITVSVAMPVPHYMPSWHGQGTCKSYVFPVHAMKTWSAGGGIAPLTLNLGARCRTAVNFTPWPL